MPAIGFDEFRHGLLYEGDGLHGHAVWPVPVLSIATVLASGGTSEIPHSTPLNEALFIFREDSFDPVTRIRRGRLYEASRARPQTWRVQPHPAYHDDIRQAEHNGGSIEKRLYEFKAWLGFRELPWRGSASALVALGTKEAYTLWRVVDIERTLAREDLLTLRARAALGVLPELEIAKIPQEGRSKVLETIDRLSNSAYRAGPEDVVESARATAQCCLGVYLATREDRTELRQKDIGELMPFLENARLLRSLAQIFARLHSRAKPNEQEKYETRPLLEGDAEFALASVGMLIRELGWAV